MFDSYRNKYDNVRMKRENGILELSYGLALEGISAAQVARLNAQKAKG